MVDAQGGLSELQTRLKVNIAPGLIQAAGRGSRFKSTLLTKLGLMGGVSCGHE